ncbi:hypothetical protein [Pseudomonas sp. RC10]|uniref:hypothetical protein n=1 Tax=Pseudomonas bambusae TaxID=3139142 RepID=UPI003139108E
MKTPALRRGFLFQATQRSSTVRSHTSAPAYGSKHLIWLGNTICGSEFIREKALLADKSPSAVIFFANEFAPTGNVQFLAIGHLPHLKEPFT